MESDTLCICCNWHEKNPAPQARRACGFNPSAPQARIACRLSLPDQSAFMPRPANTAGAGGLNPLSSALAACAACGRTSPRLCAAIWRRRLLWGAVRFVWAVTYIRTAPRPVGANCVQAQPAASYDGGDSMGSDTSYNEQALLREAVRLVQAVTCVRTAPRPVGANCVQAQPAASYDGGGSCGKRCVL